eukprot:6191611-Pleurochrysis_carterae.AAC.1
MEWNQISGSVGSLYPCEGRHVPPRTARHVVPGRCFGPSVRYATPAGAACGRVRGVVRGVRAGGTAVRFRRSAVIAGDEARRGRALAGPGI